MSAARDQVLLILEQRLAQVGAKLQPGEAELLLADEFVEFGASGRIWRKADILEALQQWPASELTVEDFRVTDLGGACCLVTYRLTSIAPEGLVKLTCLDVMTRLAGRPRHPEGRLCGRSQPRDFPPDLESLTHLLAILGGREPVAPRSEVLGDGAISGKEALGVSWGFEFTHASFSLPGRLVRIFRTIIEVAVLPMFDTGQDLALGRTVAPQLIGNNDPRNVRQALEQLAEELLRRLLVTPALHQNIENVPVLVNGAPQVVAFAPDREEDLIEVPLVTWSGTPAAEPIGEDPSEFPAPIAHSFVC
jgi:hypothetical protein